MDLATFRAKDFADVAVVMTDIDDTITTSGALRATTYAALESLADAGIAVVPVTGRPAGWCDMIARFWPVAGVVGENGALWFSHNRTTRQMQSVFAQDEVERRDNRRRLDMLAEQILADVPGCALASDQPYRLTDLAIDYSEDVPRLSEQGVDRIVSLFCAAGATAKVSSIHVNGWFGTHEKLSMTRRVLEQAFGIKDAVEVSRRIAFVGDSPNDEPMFRAFALSVGVANVRDYVGRMQHMPRYVVEGRGGDGFVSFARELLRERGLRHDFRPLCNGAQL